MDILTRRERGCYWIEFNRPQKKNALTRAMYGVLAEAITDAEADPEVRVIVIAGKPEIFTAGNDLEDFMQHAGPVAAAETVRFMHALQGATKPVVAGVSGAAIGIGSTMLLHCDLVYAADSAKFSLPFTQLGLCPEFASSLLLPQLTGHQRAAEKLLLGEAFSAQEAHAIGLVSSVVPAQELEATVLRQAAKLAALPAPALRATKRLMKSAQAAAVTERIAEENAVFVQLLASGETKEALQAFAEKRKPDFSKFAGPA